MYLQFEKFRFISLLWTYLQDLSFLESQLHQIFLDKRDVIAFKNNRSIHLVDARVTFLSGSRFNQSSQVLLELPDVALDGADLCGALEATKLDAHVNRQHEILRAFDEVGKLAVFFGIWRCPTWRIFGLDCGNRDGAVAEKLLNVLPFWGVFNHFDLGMKIDVL